MVVIGTGGIGSRFIREKWTEAETLDAETGNQTGQERLVAEQSFLKHEELKLLRGR